MTENVRVERGARTSVRALTAELTRDGKAAVVADERVLEHFGDLDIDAPVLSLVGGEAIKTFATLERVLDFCAESGLSRGSVVVALGGGTVGDLTGLAASLFKRGVAVVQVPTTLLAQVDASVGGKTAVNLASGKNLAGTFHHPSAVVCDPEFLATLDDDDYASGLGEVVKTAIIEGEHDLAALEADARAVAARDPDGLTETIRRSVATKKRVVASDPEEHGPRRALNLGHTFAHAIEHAAGYGAVPHGVAVGVGLVLAARAAEAKGEGRQRVAAEQLSARTTALLTSFGLCVSIDELRAKYDVALEPDALLHGLGHDKKGAVGRPEFVIPREPGVIDLGIELEPALVGSLLR